MTNDEPRTGQGNIDGVGGPDSRAREFSAKTTAFDHKGGLAHSLSWRRAGLNWAKAIQDASLNYQNRVSSATAVYQNTLVQIARESWEKELTAIDESEGDSSITVATDAIEKWRAGIGESQREAYRRTLSAARRCAEESESAWFDFLEKQKDANSQYVEAIKGLDLPFSSAAAMGCLGWAW
jgi:hypothetical protein